MKMRYRLVMYKQYKFFLAQSFDSGALAIKQGDFYLSTSEQDGIPRGYVIEDTQWGWNIYEKGDLYETDK